MKVTVTAPKALSVPGSPLWNDILHAVSRGLTLKDNPDGTTTVAGISDKEFFTIDKLLGCVAAGCEITGFPCFVEVASGAYAANDVPSYLPNATILDNPEDENSERPRKWSEWHDGNHSHRLEGGSAYVPLNGFGRDQKGSVIAQLIADGYDVKAMGDWPASEGE
mgnify:CR=1 FL=1